MANLSWKQANILYLWVMTLLYGVYIVIFATSIYLLAFRERRSTVKKHMLWISVALFIMCTAQNILSFLQGFLTTDVLANGVYPGETQLALGQKELYDFMSCIGDFLTVTSNLLADGLLIWRCFMIWGRKFKVIITPIIMLVSGTVCGYISVAIDAKFYLMRIHAPISAPTPLPGWTELVNLYYYIGVAFYATSFVTNVLMSFLIAGRIWWMTRGARQYFGSGHGKQYQRVASLIIESGAIYSAILLVLVILSPLGDDAAIIASDIFSSIAYQIVGMFPTLIIVLVALGKTSDQTIMATKDMVNRHAASHSLEFVHPNTSTNAITEIHNADPHVIQISRLEPREKSNPGRELVTV